MLAATLALCACTSNSHDEARAGALDGEGLVIATGQRLRPAGEVLRFAGRPVDLALAPDGSSAFVKEVAGVVRIDLATWSVVDRLPFGKDQGASMHGIAVSRDGSSVYATDAKHALRVARSGADGRLAWTRSIDLPAPSIGGEPYPCGLALSTDERRAVVCLSRSNSIAIVDLERGTVAAEIAVGAAPFDVVLAPDERCAYVSDFGGRRARAGERTAHSADTEVLVDERGVASSGTVTKVDLDAGRAVATIEVGLHPTDLELTRDGRRLYVAAANSDAVFAIDTEAFAVVEAIDVRLDEKLAFGCIVNALALSSDERRLYAANGGNNALACIRLGQESAPSVVEGFVPTDWFPGALARHGEELYVASVRGAGSRDPREAERWHSRWHQGSLARLTANPAPDVLAHWTARAREDARVPAALRAARRARTGVAPVPVPRAGGEPSVFEHVVYVIKENRTYDQVFGDLPRGNGDPRLCIFGRDVTPNHHALAEQFALLDNYYCNGVLSCDGHQWAIQGLSADYIEKQFGGWTRSYDFGTDALTYAASDFLWDACLLAGLSFRNYGELQFPQLTAPFGGWFAVHRDWKDGSRELAFTQSVEIEALRRHSAPRYPGWELAIPDQVRIDRFLEEFREAERTGEWQDLVIVYLPQDHTSGTSKNAPTPRAMVADNDLALGRLVEAISKSRFWKTTCIFVNEDDPQDGFDHVDGHRSLCLVASPYTRRGSVVSTFYNQTSVLHTIARMLGFAPMTQLVALAPTMEDCFTERADLTPFEALPARVPLDERNPTPAARGSGDEARAFAIASESMDLSRPDRIDDDAWNRILWFASKGSGAPYPAELAGAHGRGLKALSLTLDDEGVVDDDDER
jgi:hypothetical protein